MTTNDVHHNAARKSKASFQAMLKPEDVDLVAAAMAATGETTARGLLLRLCRERLERSDSALERADS